MAGDFAVLVRAAATPLAGGTPPVGK